VVPFRVFGMTARTSASPPESVLFGLAARSEYYTRYSTAGIGSAVPLCR